MIPYYSPNFKINDFISSLFIKEAELKCVDFYKKYTGKKYILITSSCRSALYLAYKSIEKRGDVIASPLICSTALEPIIESGNNINFIDVSEDTFNFDENLLPKDLNETVIAIQATYFGGRPMDMEKLLKYKREHNLILIEDCAQGFGSKYENNNLGSFGDIACYSMIKTAYGISGGILATDDLKVFECATKIQDSFNKQKRTLTIYRVLRNILDTYRTNSFICKLYNILLGNRPIKNGEKDFVSLLKRPSLLATSIFVHNIKSFDKLHSNRIDSANIYSSNLDCCHSNFIRDLKYYMVPTKYFVYKDNFNSKMDIKKLNGCGIEAKHLQQKYQSYYQDSYNLDIWNGKCKDLTNFNTLHNRIISLPLYEKLNNNDLKTVVNCINNGKEKNNLA